MDLLLKVIDGEIQENKLQLELKLDHPSVSNFKYSLGSGPSKPQGERDPG